MAAYPKAERTLARVMAQIDRARERRGRWQKPLLAIAAGLFGLGCLISLRHLDLALDQVQVLPLLALVFVFVPLTIGYSALNMVVMAQAAGARMTFWYGVQITAYAQIAELLPIPGGAVVRTAALMKAGGKTWRSAELVLAFSLLWIACAAGGAGIALSDQFWPLLVFGCGGGIGVLAISAWIGVRYGAKVAASALSLRILGLGLTAWRLAASFAAIGVGVSFISSLTFAFTTIAGSASSIAPGGLGIGESLAALLAGPAGVAPAAAFLAAALSRLVGIGFCALLAMFFTLRGARPERAPDISSLSSGHLKKTESHEILQS